MPDNDPKVGDVICEAFRVGAVHPGGMGIVYRVRAQETGQILAMKSLKWPATESARVQFEAEALNWIAAPHHENVVTAFQVLVERGRPYLVMEYIDGGSLANRLRQGPLPRPLAIDFGCQLCLGMAALSQSREIAHLDLKPSNILISRDGNLLITDFGLVKVTTAFGSRPSQETMGTYLYASPEQYFGEVIDTRADIFSFGILFHELLTGNQPYPLHLTGNAASDTARLKLMHRVLRENKLLSAETAAETGANLAALRELLRLDLEYGDCNPLGMQARAALEGDVGRIVSGCLSEYAEKRWQSFAALGKKLATIASPDRAAALERLSEPDPPHRAPHQAFLLAVSYQNLGYHDEAIDSFNRFLSQRPKPDKTDMAQAFERVAYSYEAQGDADNAADCRAQAARLDGSNERDAMR